MWNNTIIAVFRERIRALERETTWSRNALVAKHCATSRRTISPIHRTHQMVYLETFPSSMKCKPLQGLSRVDSQPEPPCLEVLSGSVRVRACGLDRGVREHGGEERDARPGPSPALRLGRVAPLRGRPCAAQRTCHGPESQVRSGRVTPLRGRLGTCHTAP